MIANLTACTLGNCVAVYTTCAIRVGIDPAAADDTNDELRSTVAMTPEMRTPSSAVPAGICEPRPAARSAADGPASTAPIAAVATPVVAGTDRSVTNSLPPLANHACRLVWPVGLGVGDVGPDDGWPPGDCGAVAEPLADGEAGPDGCELPPGDVEPAGTGPSDPAVPVPHPAVSNPNVSNPALASTMGRGFMTASLAST